MPKLLTRALGRSLAALLLAGAVTTGLAPRSGIAAEAVGNIVTNDTGAYLAGRSATSQRDIAAAAEFFSRVLEGDPMNASLTERALLLWISNGQVDTAIDLAKRLIVLNAGNDVARLTLAAAAIKSGDPAAALPHLTEITDGPLAAVTSGILAAWVQQGEGKTDEALATIAALQGPEWFALFKSYHTGLINESAGRLDAALAAMREAYGVDPSVKTVEGYARLLARTGDRNTAEEVLVDYLAGAANQPTATALLEAVKAGTELGPIAPDAAAGASEVLYAIATALTGDGAADRSTIYLQLALYLEPDNAMALIALGQLFQALERHGDAIALYGAVPETSPVSRIATVQRAVSLDIIERGDESIAALRSLIERDPTDTTVLLALGNVLRGHENFAGAADAYGEAIAATPTPIRTDWTMFYFRGIAYERSKQWPLAEADFKKALELFPDQPQVLNYLGYSWVDQGLNLDEAMGMIEKAVELRPQDGYIVDSLGWAHYKLGDYAAAVTELERAVELMPFDPTINDHLGDAYWQVGRKLEAVYQWSHARDLEPEAAELSKIVQKLESGLPPGGPDKDG